MHPNAIAERKAHAQERSEKAIEKLAKVFKVDLDADSLKTVGRDPAVAAMLKDEAFANILEALAAKAKKTTATAAPATPTAEPVAEP
jgi:hypothetical protein